MSQPVHEPIRLHIPGPVQISPETYAATTRPMIGHRSKDFVALYDDIHPKLQTLFGTSQPVFLSTSSAWGVMEGCIRNLVAKKVLCCCSGAFSDKWVDVARRCGKGAEALQYEWGTPVNPDDVAEKLSTGEFDTVTFIHNETSTGVLNPLEEVAAVVKLCHEQNIPFVTRGAGTGLSGGALPLKECVLIVTTCMQQILNVDYNNQQVVVQPGVINNWITQAVSGAGFYYAPDPSSQLACSIGGNVAENSGGVHCLKYGVTTNHVLGLKLVLPNGNIVDIGGA
ncbi:MAG: FAD-binding protein, partial [Verrucomicrobiota bacterium]